MKVNLIATLFCICAAILQGVLILFKLSDTVLCSWWVILIPLWFFIVLCIVCLIWMGKILNDDEF